ncbi:DUF5615 family PIN-like protein [Halomicroarcula sp. GCM10025709]|uniref:DUF5615 family PIN-like protein n=1 Tax=Haloarcula TaxID=2237 RepID=UPI0024C3261A|nr:DUF5615 family PIN-like protein [Halomicroarcula sp. YJ-61-S]
MRILVDQNSAQKYVDAFEQADNITVATVDDGLEHDTPDADIDAYAETHDWVVFTNDDDFFVAGGDHGLLLYDQIDDPAPGDVVAAVRRIEQAYTDSSEITESVPGGWV